jgi:hypothetical protein
MKSLKQVAMILGALVVIGAGVYFYYMETPTLVGNDIVGPAHVVAKIEGSAKALGVTVTPHEVVEDSRCPLDVNCIWAGTLKVRATLSSDLGTSDQVFELGTPITTESVSVTLEKVAPNKHQGVTVSAGEYLFYFVMKRR